MSGAQGALPPESKTTTTYESISGGENKTKIETRSKEDQGMIQIDNFQDKVQDAAGKGGAVLIYHVGKDENKQDLGVTGIPANENLT
ncbi:hypothetical protein RGQ29_018766 [Quercus rubra]|uniref:Uncharacterized protein n=1 Tax=Quercus rubra TaxID=3512 RepID=A0AAN7J2E5_QUERU|nr:hypothetical protein RGQ29_018766 [Quercus rubra]